MKTVTTEYNETIGKWAVRINGEWLRTPKRNVCRWFRTEQEALRAAARAGVQ